MKTVLLLAPAFLDLYKDVISELVKQGYKVEYIQDKSFKIDPYLIRIKQSSRFKGLFYNLFLCFYWLKIIFRKRVHIPEHTRSISDGEFSRKIG